MRMKGGIKEEKKSSFEKFLTQMEIQVHSREIFVKKISKRNPLTSFDYSIFLDEEQRVKKNIFPLIKDTISQFNLKIYFVMVSWWGRGDLAMWTGSDLLATLKNFEKQELCEVFLSYQEGDIGPSNLCEWCKKHKIQVIYADQYQLISKEKGEVVVPRKAPGKTENVIKALKFIDQIVSKEGHAPEKVLVIFVDDDYTQYHWINYLLILASWVFSFVGETGDREIDEVIKKIKRISFIKSGSPRIILPYELQEQLVHGGLKVMDYLDVTLAIVDLALAHQRFGMLVEKNEIDDLILALQKIKKSKQIYSPRNRAYFLDDKLNKILEEIWRQYIYRGGRVTQRLEGIFRYLSHYSHYRWLRQFTFLLHGDQGAPLNAWLEFSPFSGYALEISLLLQAVWGKAFQNHQVINAVGLPHSHQRSKDLAIWNMLDTILLAIDLSRVFYGDLSEKNFLSLYKRQQFYPMLDRFGEVIKHQPQYRGLKIYPPLKNLTIE